MLTYGVPPEFRGGINLFISNRDNSHRLSPELIGSRISVPMAFVNAYGGLNQCIDAFAELARNPVSKHQIQPEHGDEQVDARRDCRNRLARPNNSQARTERGQRNIHFPLFS